MSNREFGPECFSLSFRRHRRAAVPGGATRAGLRAGDLKYFEETGGAHFEGNRFVFDEREALGPSLQPAPTKAAPAE
jgi:hypothetical protein